MVNPASCRFINQHSVRFTLDSFALPVTGTKKKNCIYTNYITQLRGTKRKLLPATTPPDLRGYNDLVYWNNWAFATDHNGIYYADRYALHFNLIEANVSPSRLAVANDRLFLISADRRRIVYSVDLTTDWINGNLLSGSIYLPESYGSCLEIMFYRTNLLVICENGLLAINRQLNLKHISDDSELLKTNLAEGTAPRWESDWFSLGYATNTQNLREVFLKTDTSLTLVIESNRTQRIVHVPPAGAVQKIKTNLNGDQFKLTILVNGDHGCVSNLSAVVVYGKRG